LVRFAGTPKLGFSQKNEDDGQEFQHHLASQNEEASKEALKTDGCTMHGTNGSKLTSPTTFLNIKCN